MIIDEQILDLATQYAEQVEWDIDTGLHPTCFTAHQDSILRFARELIALAQQVKPLQFEPCQLPSPVLPLAYLNAKSPLGRYLIHKYKDGGKTVYFFTGPNRVASDNETEAEAIAAANEDYQRKVLSCLVSGDLLPRFPNGTGRTGLHHEPARHVRRRG